jgi:hypothetical protein
MFLAGLALGATGYAHDINTGLVEAWNSVGKNLFGHQAFAAAYVPASIDEEAVQVDVVIPPDDAGGSAFRRVINIVFPPDPVAGTDECFTAFQLEIDAFGGIRGIINPDIYEFRDFPIVEGVPEGHAFCSAPVLNPDGE